MFKQKKVLPAGPEIPKLEEIHQDIVGAAEDDVVFKLTTNDGGKTSTHMNASTMATVDEEQKNHLTLSPGDAYDEVKKFIEANANIKQLLSVIGDLCFQLEDAGSKLTQQMTAVQMQVHTEAI